MNLQFVVLLFVTHLKVEEDRLLQSASASAVFLKKRKGGGKERVRGKCKGKG